MHRANRIALIALAAAAAGSLGCMPARRDLTVRWTFGGQTCAVAGVTSIQVDLDGEYLSPDTFPCMDGKTVNTQAYLGRFLLGEYLLTVSGLDENGNLLYQSEEQILITDQRDNVIDFDVSSGAVTLAWTFDGQGCAAAGVDVVHVSIDGQPVTDDRYNPDLGCTNDGADGVTISPIDPGLHTFDLTGFAGNTKTFSLTGLPITIVSGKLITVTAALLSAAPSGGGSASLLWTFAGMSCATAKVDQVQILVDGASSGTVPCTSAGVDGAAVDGLTAGQHTFKLVASRTAGSTQQLVYLSQVAATADLVEGLTTSVVLDAPASSPGRGGVALTWKFPAGGPDCTVTTGGGTPIAVTLKDPGGVVQAASATCGGASGGTSLTFCNPAAGGCSAGDTGLAAGNWTLTASVAGTPAYAASLVFGVPNAASGAYDVTFAAQ